MAVPLLFVIPKTNFLLKCA